MTGRTSFTARYWAALTGSHPAGRRGPAPRSARFGHRYLAALAGLPGPVGPPPPAPPTTGAMRSAAVRASAGPAFLLAVPVGKSPPTTGGAGFGARPAARPRAEAGRALVGSGVTGLLDEQRGVVPGRETPHGAVRLRPGVDARVSRWRFGVLVAVVAAGLATALAAVVPLLPAAVHLSPPPPGVVAAPADVVVLVDASAGLGPAELARERQAVELIAASELSPRSTLSVAGFGGAPGLAEVCPRLEPAGAARALRDCLAGLRPAAGGGGTDHGSALAHALTRFEPAGDDRLRLLYLLTGSAGAGSDDAGRLDAALAAARERGVRIRPVGFGAADRATLDRYAAGGAGEACRPARAAVVPGADDLVDAVASVIAAGRCADGQQGLQRARLGPEGVRLPVAVPDGAVAVAVVVLRDDRRVSAALVDPAGRVRRPEEPDLLDVLRVERPLAGRWEVLLSSPPDLAGQEVRVGVVWASEVR